MNSINAFVKQGIRTACGKKDKVPVIHCLASVTKTSVLYTSEEPISKDDSQQAYAYVRGLPIRVMAWHNAFVTMNRKLGTQLDLPSSRRG